LVSVSAPSDEEALLILDDRDVYPSVNPAVDSCPVSFINAPAGSSLRLYNIAGELVFEEIYDGEKWSPPSDISSGIYIYLIEYEGRIVRGKLGIIR